MSKIKENVLLIYIVLIAVALGILIAAAIAFYVTFETSETITSGVYIKDVDVSGMTKEEAKTAVSSYLEEQMADHLVFKYSNYEYNVEIEQIEAEFDIDSAVNYAFNIGRTRGFWGNVQEYASVLLNKINIEPVLVYNEEALDDYIDFLEVSLPDQVEQAAYYIEDGNLVITTGSTGAGINKDSLKEMVLEAIQDNSYSDTVFVIPTYTTYPDEIDIDAIYSEVYKEMSNAYYTTDPYAIYSETTGVDFDVQEVKNTITEVRNR